MEVNLAIKWSNFFNEVENGVGLTLAQHHPGFSAASWWRRYWSRSFKFLKLFRTKTFYPAIYSSYLVGWDDPLQTCLNMSGWPDSSDSIISLQIACRWQPKKILFWKKKLDGDKKCCWQMFHSCDVSFANGLFTVNRTCVLMKQARKLGRCNSNLQNPKTLPTDWLTDPPTDQSRCYCI